MLIRPAVATDAAAIEAFLARHADTSMFLRHNLAQMDLHRGCGTIPCDFWIRTDDRQITGVFGLTANGYALMQFPDGPPDWPALRARLSGRKIVGLNGDAPQVADALIGLELSHVPKSLDRIEPLMTLDLQNLTVPTDPATKLRRATDSDISILTEWRTAYMVEIMGFHDRDHARGLAGPQAAHMIADDVVRLLDGPSGPVAMTGFNARLPGSVQVASVYAPPEYRRRGNARRAVALHLVEVAQSGVTHAVLFAANDPARRAYEAIGFRKSGEYHLVILAAPITVGVEP